MKFRRFAQLSVAAIAVFAIAGCAPGGQATQNSAGAEDREVSTEIGPEEVTLRMATTAPREMVEAYIEGFNELYPQVTIEPEYAEFAAYNTSVNLTMTSNTPPDIAQYGVVMKELVPGGELLSLEQYREAYGWDDVLPGAALAFSEFSDDGKRFGEGDLYGVPTALSETGIFVNKAIAAELGIELPIATLGDLEDAMDKALAAGYTPMEAGGLDTGTLHLWANLLDVLMPSDDFRAWVNGQEGGSITGPGALAATEKLADWAARGFLPADANANGQAQSTANFVEGDTLFLFNGTWAVTQVNDVLGDDGGFFTMPGETADSPATMSGSSVAFMVSSRTEHPDAAVAFLDYMASAEGGKVAVDQGYMPPHVDTKVEAEGATRDLLDAFAAVMADDGMKRFPDSAAPGIIDRMTPGIQALTAGRGDPVAFLAELQEFRDEYHSE
ncbi:ABC transporter substrate-binding protein [Microbacterium sp. A93]|uniref:ABC transporter substrate-binding protein n=1 Tax=Microbacterium sp. A93 TaxID=3450716 RepID=UPI003F431C07